MHLPIEERAAALAATLVSGGMVLPSSEAHMRQVLYDLMCSVVEGAQDHMRQQDDQHTREAGVIRGQLIAERARNEELASRAAHLDGRLRHAAALIQTRLLFDGDPDDVSDVAWRRSATSFINELEADLL